jgi:hypothetical protein
MSNEIEKETTKRRRTQLMRKRGSWIQSGINLIEDDGDDDKKDDEEEVDGR